MNPVQCQASRSQRSTGDAQKHGQFELVPFETLPLHLDALDTGLQHFVLSRRISLDNRPPGADTSLPDSGERGSAKPAELRTRRTGKETTLHDRALPKSRKAFDRAVERFDCLN